MRGSSKNSWNLQKWKIDAATIAGILIILMLFLSMPIILQTRRPLAYVSSGSMEESYFTGDLIIARGVKSEEVEVGDEILYERSDGTIIFHRVAYVEERLDKRWYITKGDKNNAIDSWSPIPEDKIIGKVVYRIPFLGYIPLLAKEYLLFPLFLLLIVLLLMMPPIELRSVERQIAKAILVLSIACLSFFWSMTEVKHSVELLGIVVKESLTTEGIVRYVLVRLRVESTGFWLESIRYIKAIAVSKDGRESYAVWKICYNFHGEKEFSLAIIINENFELQKLIIVAEIVGPLTRETIRRDIAIPALTHFC